MSTTESRAVIRPTRVIVRRSTAEMREMDAWTTATPGLVLLAYDGKWLPLHERSGTILCLAFDNPEQAHAAVARLGNMRDWTRGVRDLEMNALQMTQTWQEVVSMGEFVSVKWCGPEDISELMNGA